MQTLSALDPRAVVRAEVEAQELKRALDRVKPAVVARSAQAALRSVLVQADDALTVCATDLDLTIRTRLDATVAAPGSVVVPFASLRATVGRLRGAIVLELSPLDDELTVSTRAGASKTGLATLPLADFTAPSFRGLGGATHLDLGAIRRVLPAASRDKARPRLGVVLLDGNDVVATDSYRLHLERVTDRLPRCLLPAHLLAAVAATRHHSADVRVDRRAELAQLVVPGTEYLVRTVPGDWFDYKRLVPGPSDTDVLVATLDAVDLLAAAAQLRPLAASTSPAPPVWLCVAPRQVTISMDAPGVGNGEVKLDAEVRGGGGTVDIAFDLAFLTASVQACDSQRISLHIRGPRKPAVIVADGVDWSRPGNGLRLLMPVFADRPAAVVDLPASVDSAGADSRDDDGSAPDNVVPLRELRARPLMRRRAARR